MTPEQISASNAKELALYKQEVSAAKDPKLHILIVHLYIEHLLERYLTAQLKTTKRLFGKNGLGFEKKLLMIEAMGGFSPQQIDSIRKLNALRNDCAHQFKYQPSNAELEAFGRTLGKAYSAIKLKAGDDQNKCMRSACAHLCGKLAKAVVTVEHAGA